MKYLTPSSFTGNQPFKYSCSVRHVCSTFQNLASVTTRLSALERQSVLSLPPAFALTSILICVHEILGVLQPILRTKLAT